MKPNPLELKIMYSYEQEVSQLLPTLRIIGMEILKMGIEPGDELKVKIKPGKMTIKIKGL